jgi:hypothetical protein
VEPLEETVIAEGYCPPNNNARKFYSNPKSNSQEKILLDSGPDHIGDTSRI